MAAPSSLRPRGARVQQMPQSALDHWQRLLARRIRTDGGSLQEGSWACVGGTQGWSNCLGADGVVIFPRGKRFLDSTLNIRLVPWRVQYAKVQIQPETLACIVKAKCTAKQEKPPIRCQGGGRRGTKWGAFGGNMCRQLEGNIGAGRTIFSVGSLLLGGEAMGMHRTRRLKPQGFSRENFATASSHRVLLR